MTSTRRISLALLAASVLFAAAWQPTPALAQGVSGEMRVYQTRFITMGAAMALAMQVCGEDSQHCHVEAMDSGSFILRGGPSVHAQIQALLDIRDVPPPTQEFRVILLEANDSGSIPDLPDGARQAVEDVLAVLPYTGFTLIDSSWVRTSRDASTSLGEAGSFTFELRFEGDPRQDSALLVHFGLQHQQVFRVPVLVGDEEGPRVQLGDRTSVLTSQFGIGVGETVVVGTSRINGGNQALVVLLTALDR